MTNEFLDFWDNVVDDETKKLASDSVKTFIEALRASSGEEKVKPEITDNGKAILDYMQNSGITALTSKKISEGIFLSSRVVSGGMRKLVNDGFCEKIGANPAVYVLTEKGKNYKICG